MHAVDAVSAAQPVAYGPYILLLISILAGVIGWFLRKVLGTLAAHTTALAVLVEHNIRTDSNVLDLTKAHDELIDLKVASSELNARTENHETRLLRLESFHDQTHH